MATLRNKTIYDEDMDAEEGVGLIEAGFDDEPKNSSDASEADEAADLSADEIPRALDEADTLFADGCYREALDKYEAIYKVIPADDHVVNRLACTCAIRGKIKRLTAVSLEWMKSLEEQGRVEMAGMAAYAVNNFDLGSLEARLGILRYMEKVKSEDDYIAAVLKYSDYFVDIGLGEQSVKLLDVALNAHPARMELAVKLADIHMQLGNIAECTKQCQNIAAFYEGHQDYAKASELYRRLRLLTPEDIGIALRLAELYFILERYEDAVSEYRACMHIAYDNREALFGLARALLKTDNVSDACLALRKILALNPADTEARELLGDSYAGSDNPSEAVKEYTAAANTFLEMRDYEAAKSVLEKIAAIDDANAFAVRELSNVKDMLAQKEARAARMAEMVRKAQEIRNSGDAAAEEHEGAKKAAVSEEDLYADDGPSGGFDGELDNAEDEFAGSASPAASGDEFLPLMADAASAAGVSSKPAAKKAQTVTRVLAAEAKPGQLQVPVPFVAASYPDTVELMQQLISEPPARDVIPWEFLSDIDDSGEEENAAEGSEAAEAKTSKVEKPSGPVASAFASSGGSLFSAGAFSNVTVQSARRSRKRRGSSRRGRWEFVPEDEDYDEEEDSRDSGSSIQDSLARRFGAR